MQASRHLIPAGFISTGLSDNSKALAAPRAYGTHDSSARRTNLRCVQGNQATYWQAKAAMCCGIRLFLRGIRRFDCIFLRSHSTSHQMSRSMKQRMSRRPSFVAHKNASIIINTPTSYEEDQFRTNACSQHRATIARTTTPHHLMSLLREVLATKRADASVFAASAQRCGKGRWWDALLQVRAIQQESRIILNAITLNCFLTALSACTRAHRGGVLPSEVLESRCQQILQIARDMWNETKHHCIRSLTSALKLCSALPDREALDWAEQLWSSAAREGYHCDMLAFSQYAQVLASHKLHTKVDNLLQECFADHNVWRQDGFEHTITLSALLDISARQRDCHRADKLWVAFVDGFAVKPNAFTYNAWAKVHLMCGRPNYASSILDQVPVEEKSANIAEQHAQALLVTYHSSQSSFDKRRLDQSLKQGDGILNEAGRYQRQVWENIKRVAHRVKSDASSLSLQDVLVTWLSSTSVMGSWGDLSAGSDYLPKEGASHLYGPITSEAY